MLPPSRTYPLIITITLLKWTQKVYMDNFKENAVNLFQQGYSCSESVVRAAYQSGLIDKNIDIESLNKVASVFSGGMGNGCLCGAVAGAQMIIGVILGREDING
ncbi:MAG TPA: hypothetical protein DDX14_03570, partial [Cyanobacteria bacterium UBA9579]|nr:hypothetical protein [Cyanobacteria bacterium UBA9579]